MVYEDNVGAGRSHIFGALSPNKKTTPPLGGLSSSIRSHFYYRLEGPHGDPELEPPKEPCHGGSKRAIGVARFSWGEAHGDLPRSKQGQGLVLSCGTGP